MKKFKLGSNPVVGVCAASRCEHPSDIILGAQTRFVDVLVDVEVCSRHWEILCDQQDRNQVVQKKRSRKRTPIPKMRL